MTTELQQLEIIVEKIGEAVLATTETVERLAEKVENLAISVQNQGQQQSYQIFALTEALQTFVDSQTESREKLEQLTEALQTFAKIINNSQS